MYAYARRGKDDEREVGSAQLPELARQREEMKAELERMRDLCEETKKTYEEQLKKIEGRLVEVEGLGREMKADFSMQVAEFKRSVPVPKKYAKFLFCTTRINAREELIVRRKEMLENSIAEEMEAHQFEGIDDVDRVFCHGLFGDEDTIGLPWRDAFEHHYPGMSRMFHGGHRMNAEVVRRVLIPFIRELKILD